MINKYAPNELKTLIRIHTANINAWAGVAEGATVSASVKEALLATTARLYELIEELPQTEPELH